MQLCMPALPTTYLLAYLGSILYFDVIDLPIIFFPTASPFVKSFLFFIFISALVHATTVSRYPGIFF